MTVSECLAVPYRLATYATRTESGEWKRRAEYAEIGLRADSDALVDAIEELEKLRVAFIVEKCAAGEPIPVPRPALQSIVRELDGTHRESLE